MFILSRRREEYDASGSTSLAIVAGIGRWNWWLPRRPAQLLRVEPSLPSRVAPAQRGA